MSGACGFFVNIDDGEAHYLKVLCDGLFGRDNFIRNIVWQKRTSPDMRATVGDGHDHILLFAKDSAAFSGYAKRLPKTPEQRATFNNPDNDPRGPWVSSDFTAQGYRPNQMYKIVTPGGAEYYPPEGRCWKNVELNREDSGRRKFILVEMADYFDTVLLPRIKKVTFTPEWKDGKPRRMATAEEAERGPRVVKVVRLESYEDSLNNIAFDETSGQQVLQFEDYLLRYMLQWEARKSETLLDVERLSRPFSYQLHIHRDGETRTQPVDLPETFNYLLGLDVQTRRVCAGNGQRYLVYRGTTREGRKAAVIWRETEGWGQADYERDRAFVAGHKLIAGADEVYVNGDSLVPGARSLDRLFKERMFAPVEA